MTGAAGADGPGDTECEGGEVDVTMFFEPFAPLFEFSRQMDRLLPASAAAARTYVPAADVVVTDDDISVYMDVPGFKMDDLELELRDDVLTVRGERALPYGTGQDGRVWHRIERGFGEFERVLRLPAGLDPDGVEAGLVDGVLEIRMPVPASRKPRRIEIGGRAADTIEEHATAHEEREREAVPA